MADGGKVERQDGNLKWYKSRKLSALLSAPHPQTGSRHTSGAQCAVMEGQHLLRGTRPVPPGSAPLPFLTGLGAPLPQAAPSTTEVRAGLCWGSGETCSGSNAACPLGKRAKWPSAVSQFLGPRESLRQAEPAFCWGYSLWEWGGIKATGEPDTQTWDLILA